MLHSFFITGRLIARIAYIICLALASATLLGVGCWSSSSSHKYLLWTACLSFFHRIFRFTSFVVQNLGYLLSLFSQTCAFQITWLIVCILYACCLGSFPLIILSIFLKEAPKLSEELDGTFWAICNGVSVLIFPVFSALVFYLLFPCSCAVLA